MVNRLRFFFILTHQFSVQASFIFCLCVCHSWTKDRPTSCCCFIFFVPFEKILSKISHISLSALCCAFIHTNFSYPLCQDCNLKTNNDNFIWNHVYILVTCIWICVYDACSLVVVCPWSICYGFLFSLWNITMFIHHIEHCAAYQCYASHESFTYMHIKPHYIQTIVYTE